MSLKYFSRSIICAAIFTLGVNAALAQTQVSDPWIGASGGEWNTGANWTTTAPPGSDVNATTNAFIGTSTTVNYNLPMSAASFGLLTNYGTLNINTNGFNCGGIYAILPGSTIDAVNMTNSGCVVNDFGAFSLGTNGQATLGVGASLTAFSIGVAQNTSSHAAGTSTFTNLGGNITTTSSSINSAGNTDTGRFTIMGGTNNLGKMAIGRYAASSASTLGTEGLAIYGGIVTMTNLTCSGASFGTAYIDGGTVTNYGNVTINGTTAARYLRVIQSAGLFVVPDPSIIYENITTAGTETARYQVLGGTNIIGGIFLGTSNSAIAGTGTVTIGAPVYIGSQGIATNGAILDTITLNAGGLLGATAPWTGSANMNLSGGIFTFLAADPGGNANNITLSNALTGTGGLLKSGGGTLTFNAANTYSGGTLISAGTLALGAGGSLVTPTVVIGSGTVFDVSALGGNYSPITSQTISGFGSVNGLVTMTNGAIQPGSNALTGTLTFSSGLAEAGGAQNNFVLSANPAGPNNDAVTVTGDLTLGGTNGISISGSLPNNADYTLIQYSGTLTGGVTNFALAGAIGYLTNVANTIVLHTLATTRGPTNVIWVGNSLNNNWDASTTTNWLNAGHLDFFISGDTTLFSDIGDTNSQVNLVGDLSPANVIINTSSNYVFGGSGAIVNGGLTVSNGMVSILTANTYNGPTILDGGILATPNLANSGNASGIGAASSDPGNLIFNGGTFYYYGSSVGTDHGMTFTNSGGAIDVTNGTTLTLSGVLAGNGGFTKIDTGSLTLPNANTYTGNTVVSNGTLTLNNASAAGTGTINLYGGNLALGAVKPGNTVNIAGNNTQITGGNAGGLTGIKNVTGNGNLLLAVTANTGVFDLTGDMSAYGGTITFSNAGGNVVRMNGSSTFDGSQLATWNLGAGPTDLNIRTSCPSNNLGALEGGSSTTLTGRGGSSNAGSTTYYIGANNLSTEFDGVIQNGYGASGSSPSSTSPTSVTKIGTGSLALTGNNTYTGTTTVSTGMLALTNSTGNNGSIDDSATINIVSGAIVDVSGRNDDTFQIGNGPNQLLEGRGLINGNLNLNGSGTVAPGGGFGGNTGTLTVTNAVTLNGTVWMKLNRANTPNSDQIVSSLSTVTYGGTLIVTNIGATLQIGDTFTLFSGGSLSAASFNTIVLPIYSQWDLSQLGVNGSITLTNSFRPAFQGVDFSQVLGGNIILNVTNGAPNGPLQILTSTNATLPVAQWSTNSSTSFDGNGNLNNYYVNVDPTQPQFYILIKAE